ncbi:hypothetical protein BB561_004630 [Smittium simulii]|uniref:Cytochrome b5 heme-binding domain-containing protein n=1 Tax=Smittium simulii TaxID=133385 RepID=A0A2T9YF90_9FUNG|nr:hypothetical protein BB561_004630 [Smittium simulii]
MSKSDIITVLALAGLATGFHLLYNIYTNRSYTKDKKEANDFEKILESEYEEKADLRLTKRQLINFVGKTPEEPIYIAIRNKIYDVSVNEGRDFYGPGGAYSMFAGRDVSRLFSMFDFDGGVTEKELDAPIDPINDLTSEQEDSLDAYIQLFETKYKIVGELVESNTKNLNSGL